MQAIFRTFFPIVLLGGLMGSVAITDVSAEKSPVRVVASFSILVDMVQQVGAGRVTVGGLVGPDSDAHVFRLFPKHARMVAKADLVVINGLGFEGWMQRLVEASGYSGPVVVASTGIRPRSDDEHRDEAFDPHAWQSLPNARIYVRNIADALIRLDPEGADIYAANLRSYLLEISRLDRYVRARFSNLSGFRRLLVTSHDAFGYFGQEYGFQFLAPARTGTQSGVSAADMGAIIRQIRDQQIQAVFLENISDPRLLAQISRETGARIGGRVYSDALSSPGGPASSYLEMMRHNVDTIADALGDAS